LASALPVVSATSWGFDDATVSVRPKDAGAGRGFREKYALWLLILLFPFK
jgi:hypothetical protein